MVNLGLASNRQSCRESVCSRRGVWWKNQPCVPVCLCCENKRGQSWEWPVHQQQCVCVCLGSMILLCGLTLCGVTKHVASRNMSPHQAFTNCQYDTVSKHAPVGTAPLQQVSPMIVGQAVCPQGMSGSLQLGGPGVHREPLHALGWQVIRWVGGR